MCLGGVELLKKLNEDDFQGLLCGADCDTCRQPCNLRRIALMRNIKPPVVRHKPPVIQQDGKPNYQSWLEIAMRPYYERRRKDASYNA